MPDISDNCSHMSMGLLRILINGHGLCLICRDSQGMTCPLIAAKVFDFLNLSSSVGQMFRS